MCVCVCAKRRAEHRYVFDLMPSLRELDTTGCHMSLVGSRSGDIAGGGMRGIRNCGVFDNDFFEFNDAVDSKSNPCFESASKFVEGAILLLLSEDPMT